MSYISPFFGHIKWNFAPNFIQAFKLFIIFAYEGENNKIYPMWAKIPRDLTYLNFLHYK